MKPKTFDDKTPVRVLINIHRMGVLFKPKRKAPKRTTIKEVA